MCGGNPHPVKDIGILPIFYPSQPELREFGKIALPFFPAFDQDTVVIYPHSGRKGDRKEGSLSWPRGDSG